MQPVFPLTVHFENGRTSTYATPEMAALGLEWFDTDNGLDNWTDEHGIVTDAQGRPVRLRVETLEIVTCEVIDTAQPRPMPRKQVAA